MLKRILVFLLLSGFSAALCAEEELDLLSSPRLKPLFPDAAEQAESRLEAGSITLSRTEIDSLLLARQGSVLNLPSVDRFANRKDAMLEFRRVELMAPGARVFVVTAEGREEWQREPRHVYLASSADTSVGLVLDPVTGTTSGAMKHRGQFLKIGGNFASQLEVSEIVTPPDSGAECGNTEISMRNAAKSMSAAPLPPSASAAAAGSTISYQATVAIETDNEWMDGFDDDLSDATDWINEMFVTMNIFYERDVELQLLIGDVFLRVEDDDYTVSGSSSAKLDEFAEYWTNNMGDVDRTFAAMLSGRDLDPWYFSGIAWVDVFCNDGFYYEPFDRYIGSYSYNGMGTGWSATSAALYVGHEIGHNLGSGHTHCYSPPVDNCYNGQDGCYSGPVSCPSGGGKGTIMSYCHINNSNGAGCGTSKQEFHPTVQANIEGHLASNLGSCIVAYEEEVPDPEPEFQSAPSPDSLIDLGDQVVGTEGSSAWIQVDNLGDAALTLSCDITGGDAASFNVTACTPSVEGGGNTSVGVSCEPVQSGTNQAQLVLTTNDTDEPSAAFNLQCNGTVPPAPEFQSNPAAGATLNFGYHYVDESSAWQSISVSNSGNASLSLACSIIGTDASSFSLDACPASVSPSGSGDVRVSCAPEQSGPLQATLRVSSNDADESENDYNLGCNGKTPPPPNDMIFGDDFGG